MSKAARLLHFVLITIYLGYPAWSEAATPDIDVRFEEGSANGREIIHVLAAFYTSGPEFHTTLASFTDYPKLHAWITDTTLLRYVNKRTQEYRVEFKFPWPIGRRWSQVEVHQESPTRITWHQTAGTLKANRGEISIVTSGEQVNVEYQATLDTGLPDAWVRNHKKKFVTEFLNAAYQQATVSEHSRDLALSIAGR